jgi:hypothetical protein
MLELAHEEDKCFGPETGQLTHRMGACKLLSLTKEYFHYLGEKADSCRTSGTYFGRPVNRENPNDALV